MIPLIFPNVPYKIPQSSQTESSRFPRNTPSPWTPPPFKNQKKSVETKLRDFLGFSLGVPGMPGVYPVSKRKGESPGA